MDQENAFNCLPSSSSSSSSWHSVTHSQLSPAQCSKEEEGLFTFFFTFF
jgi:hypothetical protein